MAGYVWQRLPLLKAVGMKQFSLLYKLFFCTSFNFVLMLSLHAQDTLPSIAGVYFLSGVMETASVFDLKPDSSFEFFFSQGALDRGGSGNWSIHGDKVVLNSKKRPEKD